jgi:hypothetical protein
MKQSSYNTRCIVRPARFALPGESRAAIAAASIANPSTANRSVS